MASIRGCASVRLPLSGRNCPRVESFRSRDWTMQNWSGAQAIDYREMERTALETMLKAKADRAIFVEAWGALYRRDRLGIHQVHSRRASCSVRTDFVGRDGALRFYYREDSAAEMFLFKYCGQV